MRSKVEKDIISKELLKYMARDIARHILDLKIEDNMELIDKEFTRIEKRDADLVFKNGEQIVHIYPLRKSMRFKKSWCRV